MASLIQFDFAFVHFDFSILFDFALQGEGSNLKISNNRLHLLSEILKV